MIRHDVSLVMRALARGFSNPRAAAIWDNWALIATMRSKWSAL